MRQILHCWFLVVVVVVLSGSEASRSWHRVGARSHYPWVQAPPGGGWEREWGWLKPPTSAWQSRSPIDWGRPHPGRKPPRRHPPRRPHIGPYLPPGRPPTGIGGEVEGEGDWSEAPYQISLQVNGHHTCGGTLVLGPSTGSQIVITAAHCIMDHLDQRGRRALTILAGADTMAALKNAERNTVKKIVKHPRYHKDGFVDDIAVLLLDHDFPLGKDLWPVDLPKTDDGTNPDTLIVTGWGALQEGGRDIPDVLQLVEVPVIDNQVCEEQYSRIMPGTNVAAETNICAGYSEGGKDACQGDSGGPAVAEGPNGKYLVGVVSGGDGCARAESPGIFTRVKSYLYWIKKF